MDSIHVVEGSGSVQPVEMVSCKLPHMVCFGLHDVSEECHLLGIAERHASCDTSLCCSVCDVCVGCYLGSAAWTS